MTKNVLGKGLEALISSRTVPVEEKTGVISLRIDDIIASTYQPRSDFKKEKMAELVMSIKEKGLVEPILVRPKGDKYELVAGERRWRAAKEAGLVNIPVIIKDVSDREALELSLIENIQREDLNPLEEAKAYESLMQQFRLGQEEIAKAVGKDRSTISNTIRLLKLPQEVQAEIRKENLSMGHARALLSLEDPIKQKLIARRIVRKGLSVRETEILVKKDIGGVKGPKQQQQDVYLTRIAEELKRIFGTKVSLTGRPHKGKIEISYYSNDDLTRILDILEIKL